MKRIVSKRSKKEQIISNETWNDIVSRGWDKRYDVYEISERPLKEVPEIRKTELKKDKK